MEIQKFFFFFFFFFFFSSGGQLRGDSGVFCFVFSSGGLPSSLRVLTMGCCESKQPSSHLAGWMAELGDARDLPLHTLAIPGE